MCCIKYLAASAVFFISFALPAPALADVRLVQLANEGVILSSADTRVMIDGMVVEPYSIYAGLPADAAADFQRASGVFEGIDMALVSHRHHDHNQPSFACDFMKNSSDTDLVTSRQVIDLMREKCRGFVATSNRIRRIDPQPGQPVRISKGGAVVTVMRLSHGKRRYASIEHFGHLVEIGGKRILHIGDAAMDPEVFAESGLEDAVLDAVLIPIWFFQPGPGEAIVRDYLAAKTQIAVQVPPDEMAEARSYLADKYPGVRLLEPLEEIVLPGGETAAEP